MQLHLFISPERSSYETTCESDDSNMINIFSSHFNWLSVLLDTIDHHFLQIRQNPYFPLSYLAVLSQAFVHTWPPPEPLYMGLQQHLILGPCFCYFFTCFSKKSQASCRMCYINTPTTLKFPTQAKSLHGHRIDSVLLLGHYKGT